MIAAVTINLIKLKNIASGLGLACLVCVPICALADSQTIGTASGNATFSVDLDSIQTSGRQVHFWEKLIYQQPEIRDEASGKWIKEKRVHRVINCPEKTQGYTEGFTYGENEAFISSVSLKETQIKMNPIPPATIAEQEYFLVCAAPKSPNKSETAQ